MKYLQKHTGPNRAQRRAAAGRTSATPNHTKGSRRMYDPNRFVARDQRIQAGRKFLFAFFKRADIELKGL